MFTKLVLLLTALINVDGRTYLRGPGSNKTQVLPTSSPVIANMSNALMIIPDKSVALYNKKRKSKKPAICMKPSSELEWAKMLVSVSNSSRNEL
jgi:hypothetical protein